MLRILSLCLVILLSIGIAIPFANSAHGVRQNTQVGKSVNRRHSKAWWRRYRARMRRKRAAALARRNMLYGLPKALAVERSAAINVRLGPPPVMTMASKPLTTTQPGLPAVSKQLATKPAFTFSKPAAGTVPVVTMAQPPVMKALPAAVPAVSSIASAHTVSNPTTALPVNPTTALPVLSATSPAALKPKTKVAPLPGQMNLAVVAMSRPNPAFLTSREEAKMLAGVNVADLRRIVIDKMVMSGGWVTNDFVREVSGGRVFIVAARTPKDGRSPEKIWTFYFTEVGGRIYGITTDSAVEYSDRMTAEAERLITNLRSNPQAIKK